MAKREKPFTDDALVEAYAKVYASGGTIDDLIAELGLNVEKGQGQINGAKARLKKDNVVFPMLRRRGSESGLTPEKVAAYNEVMNPAPPVETEEPAST
jgi:hypothetical protein